ncbi:MAG: molybdopterin cofactor-binding domain-containing protein [Paracoccaceae bacterium]
MTSTIEFRKDLFADERDDTLLEIGKPTLRQDGLGHVTGRSRFFDDHHFDGLLHLRCVRSPHHHASIRSIDASAAERMPGVRKIIRGEDVPHNMNTLLSLMGFGRDDEMLIQTKRAAYRGEPVLAIVADTERQARDAVAAVRVDWEVLPHVLDVEEALKPAAPVVNDEYPNNSFDYHDLYDHQKLRFGDVAKGFAEAAHIVTGQYQMSPIEQAPTETCGAIAAPEQNGRFVCHSSTQALFFSLGTAVKLLDVPSSKLHFIGGTVGGGFGGKVDSLHEPMALLGSMLTGKPVKYIFDRAEEMQVGAPRGAELWRIKDGIAADGRVIAREFTGFFDSGAYTRLSSYAVIKGVGHMPGPYTIPNVAANVYCVFTNRTPATAMRGFGITGVDFAIERHMDKGARAVGMNPIEFRILNAYRDGDMKAHRRVAKNTALIECCQVVAGKAGVRLGAEASAASSLTGGGVGWRAEIPETVTDQAGRIGERRRAEIPLAPTGAPPGGRVAAGVRGEAVVAAPPQDADMALEAARIGHPMTAPAAAPAPQTPYPPARATVAAPPPAAPASARPATPPSTYAPAPQPPAPPPAQPETQFQRGVTRPGAPRFLSGTRRR